MKSVNIIRALIKVSYLMNEACNLNKITPDA